MSREAHVRFCESAAVKLRRATRPVSESFFATLEKELLALQPLQSRSATRQHVADYIENYYNLIRLHSHLDYVSPIAFETNATNLN